MVLSFITSITEFVLLFPPYFTVISAKMSGQTESAFVAEHNFVYNNVNNQQAATTFSFINLFNSALHVSGDKFAQPQEHFLTIYTAFGTKHLSAAVSVHRTKSCIYSQKVLLMVGEFVARNM